MAEGSAVSPALFSLNNPQTQQTRPRPRSSAPEVRVPSFAALERVARLAWAVTATTVAEVHLREQGGGSLIFRFRVGSTPARRRIAAGALPPAYQRLATRSISCGDLIADPGFGLAPDENARAFAGAPFAGLVTGFAGAVCVLEDKPRRWAARELAALEDVAAAAASSLELESVHRDTEQMKRELQRDRERAEEELRRREGQLRHVQKMEAVGRLAGGIAHDFNNLLTAIRGNAELLLLELGEGHPASGDTREIRRAADRAARLTAQLLALSRREARQPQLIELDDVVVETESMLRRLIGEDVQLTMRLRAEGSVFADPGQIEQILVNLVVNSRDAMGPGGRVTIETAPVRVEDAQGTRDAGTAHVRPGDYLALRVRDDGHGVPAEVQGRIFEPFFTTKEIGHGTGLGLSTVYGIVQQSGGAVWVTSQPGEDTTFHVLLPRAADAPHVEVTFEEREREAAGRGETILVVEDEAAVRETVRRVLTGAGYRVMVAADAREGIRLFEETDPGPDVVVTDVVMPRMSGPDMVRRLRLDRPGLRVLYLSGYADDSSTLDLLLRPETPFLQKPFPLNRLLTEVRRVLDTQDT
ncbi:hypothetical protein BH23GEM4_BH23GEM4_20260 [soil metagenome]